MNRFVVGIPYSKCKYKSEIPCTREDEAIAIAAGATLAGKYSVVFMQNSGLGHSLDVITSLLIPYGINVNIVIDNRKDPEHHKAMGNITKNIMRLLKRETQRSNRAHYARRKR